MAKAVEAGKAYVSLGLKPNMKKGLKSASDQFKKFGRQAAVAGAGVSAAGSAVLAPLLASTHVFAEMGDEIHKMSARTGVSVTALSELAFAAEQSGASVQDMEKAFFGLSRQMFAASQGAKGPKDALAELGLSFHELENLSPEEQFMAISEGLANIEDMSVRGAIAQKLFGRAGRQMLPMLAEGADGIRRLRQEANELGRSMSEEDANAAAEYTDAMNRLQSVAKGVMTQIGAALAPALADAATTFANMAKHVVKFLRENKGLIVSITAAAAVVVGLGGALTAAGFVMIGIGSALSAIAAGLGFLLSPIGAVIVGIAALGFAAEHYFGFISKAINFVIDRFGPLVSMWQDSIAAIVEALTQGDMEKAWELVMQGLEGTFLDLTAGIGAYWDTAMNVLVDATAAMAKAIGGIIKQLGSWLQTMLNGYKDYYNSVYNNVTEMIGELSGVRTIGGDVDAFGSSGDFVLEAGEGMMSFGDAMQDSAEAWRQNNQSDTAQREKDRQARLNDIRENAKREGDAARQAKKDRQAELDRLKSKELDAGDKASIARGKAVGTFSAVAAMAIGASGNVQQEQLKVQKQNQRNTKDIADNTKQNNAVFA
jgi:hypothetical protein